MTPDGGWPTIPRLVATEAAPGSTRQATITDYDAACATFGWDQARVGLGHADGAWLNIADEAVTRHAVGAHGDAIALRCLGRDDDVDDVTYRDLDDASNRFAHVVRSLGVGRGDTVFLLLGRRVELYVAFLGALKAGAVISPLFPAFGPEPVRQRMTLGGARLLVTTGALFRRKIAPMDPAVEGLDHVVIVDEPAGGLDELGPDDRLVSYEDAMRAASPTFPVEHTGPEDPALLHFTSGTTGAPKGAVHVHEAVVAHRWTASVALDLRASDVFWCTADPGWVTGTSYGVVAPLVIGCTNIVDGRDYDADRWYRTIEEQRVTVWYTSPTALRMLMRSGEEPAHARDLSSLRLIASVGEPLNPEVVVWAQRVLGLPVLDNWWQTETGGIMIANLPCLDIKPGSMGRPIPGIEAAILERAGDQGDAALVRDGEPVRAAPGEAGILALRSGWPSMFRGYLGQEERYRKSFVGDWYLSGDLARVDDDGYVWFVGRADDVIKSAGHLIGPFEVESALLEHPAVAEAGVIGTPDEVAGSVIKAFVSLASGYAPSDDLAQELIGFARRRLGPAVAPRQIAFQQDLPHTRSGKVMRRLLRDRELGLPTGDLSTLETPP